MYTQFFGNYLFSNGYVTKDQLINAIIRQPNELVQVSTLALYSGYMTAHEINFVIQEQDETGKKFSEIAIENGFLTKQQVVELLNLKSPDFLILGQVLINEEVFTFEEFENILTDYRSQNEFLDMELNEENRNDIQQLIEGFSIISETAIPNFGKAYLELFFNNLVRYIGDDFSTLPPSTCTEFATECCVSQLIEGGYRVNTYLNMDKETAISFAERYSNEVFTSFDEYVAASLEDILNLHNGLFIVNASNESSTELTIETIEYHTDSILEFDCPTFLFPICYPFGIIYFIMEVISI